MSENKNLNEEYQYVDETEIEPGTSEPQEQSEKGLYNEKINSLIQQPNVRRNAIVAVFALILLLVLIKCSGSFIPKQKDNAGSDIPYQQQIKGQTQTPEINKSAMPVQSGISSTDLSQLQSNQNNLKDAISALNDQVSQLSNQLGALSNNYQSLQQELLSTQNKLSVATQSLEEFIASQKSKPVLTARHKAPTMRNRPPINYVKYYVQAIIPGRAWLINSNGSTLTVTPGSNIPGYGTVTRILAQDGRVITSSGKILKFNQEH